MSITISCDPADIDLDVVHGFLGRDAYWCRNVPRELLAKAIANSLCFSAFDEGRQVGFARVVDPPLEATAAAHGVRSAFVFIQPSGAQLAAIAQLIDAGQMKPVIHTVLPLNEARQAQVISQGGHARGKLVLQVAD